MPRSRGGCRGLVGRSALAMIRPIDRTCTLAGASFGAVEMIVGDARSLGPRDPAFLAQGVRLGDSMYDFQESRLLAIPTDHDRGEHEKGRYVSGANLPLLQGLVVAIAQKLLDLDQVIAKAAGRVISVVDIFGRALLDYSANDIGYVDPDGRDVWYPPTKDALNNVERRLALENRLLG